MYTCLFVDDEIEIREGMQRKIDWHEQQFNEPILASNGAEAIELMESIEPDLVITDINMPYVNGLELAAWVKQQYPTTKIMILSGIEDFEYAKEAVRIHVDAYLLKPVASDELKMTIKQLVDEIQHEQERHSNMLLLEEHYRLTYPILKEKFLVSLITRSSAHDSIVQKAEKFNMNLQGEHYVVSCIDVNNSEFTKHTTTSSLAQSDDLDLKLFALSNVASEVWNKYELGYVFIHAEHLLLLSLNMNEQKQQIVESTQKALAEVMRNINRFLNLQVMIGIGSPVDSLSKLKYSYEGAYAALDYRGLLGMNSIVYIDDMELRTPIALIYDEFRSQQLTRCLKLGTREELEQVLDELFHEVATAESSLVQKQYFLNELLVDIIKTVKNYTIMEIDELSWFSNFNRLQSIEETKAWFISICKRVHTQIEKGRETKYKQVIEQAITYIKEHYEDSELSIVRVSEHLHISNGYFSGLFKKEMKITFGAYLVKVRMEKAMELLRTTDLKSFEIAERVGYAEPNYFSMSFKKYTGLSPKEYRNMSKDQ